MDEPKLDIAPRTEGWVWGKNEIGDVTAWGWQAEIVTSDPEDEDDYSQKIVYINAPDPDADQMPFSTFWNVVAFDESGDLIDESTYIAGPTPESVFAVIDAWLLDGDETFRQRAHEDLFTPGGDEV